MSEYVGYKIASNNYRYCWLQKYLTTSLYQQLQTKVGVVAYLIICLWYSRCLLKPSWNIFVLNPLFVVKCKVCQNMISDLDR